MAILGTGRPVGGCRVVATVVAALILIATSGRLEGQVPSYGTLYDPLQVLNLNLEMDPSDWNTVRNDLSYDIEKPAYFWADGENKVVVSLRRKPNLANGDKVALKIDVNEYFDNQQWHGVKKLSLENGYEKNAVSEGLAWYMHRCASQLTSVDYRPPLAAWVNVTVNGQGLGLYANVEQPDKTFLRNRDLWISGETWLYKQGDIGSPTLEAGTGESPTYAALDYSPFRARGDPPPAGYETQVQSLIDMTEFLTVGAVNTFSSTNDELLNKGKNFFFVDYGEGQGQRLYFPWDLDSIFNRVTSSIYEDKTDYQRYLVNVPAFRDQYNQIMMDLLDGPLAVTPLHDFLDQLEAALTPSLLADPYNNVGNTPGDIAGYFDNMDQWITDRHANVLQQVQADMLAAPSASTPEPTTLALVGVGLIAGLCRRVRTAARGKWSSPR